MKINSRNQIERKEERHVLGGSREVVKESNKGMTATNQYAEEKSGTSGETENKVTRKGYKKNGQSNCAMDQASDRTREKGK